MTIDTAPPFNTPPASPLLDPPETEYDHLHHVHRSQIEDQTSLSVIFRHSGWQGTRTRIFQSFHRTKQPPNRIRQFRWCGSHAYVLQSTDDPSIYRIAGSSCHDRFCLPCAKERSHAIALNVIHHLQKRTARFLTLTVKSDNEPLEELLDKLHNGFKALRQTKLWKQRVTGGVAFLEINWSPKLTRWHPHFHIVIEGKYIPHTQLRNLWYAITGDSFVVDIRQIRDANQATQYITKYASKPFNNTFLTRPERLDEAIVALKGRKLIVTFGSWRGLAVMAKPQAGAWRHVASLQRCIEQAAAGDTHSRHVLQSLTTASLEHLYQRAPPLPPTGPDRTIEPEQMTFFGHWDKDNQWQPPY